MQTFIDITLVMLPVVAAIFGGYVFRRIDEWWQTFLQKLQ